MGEQESILPSNDIRDQALALAEEVGAPIVDEMEDEAFFKMLTLHLSAA